MQILLSRRAGDRGIERCWPERLNSFLFFDSYSNLNTNRSNSAVKVDFWTVFLGIFCRLWQVKQNILNEVARHQTPNHKTKQKPKNVKALKVTALFTRGNKERKKHTTVWHDLTWLKLWFTLIFFLCCNIEIPIINIISFSFLGVESIVSVVFLIAAHLKFLPQQYLLVWEGQ